MCIYTYIHTASEQGGARSWQHSVKLDEHSFKLDEDR